MGTWESSSISTPLEYKNIDSAFAEITETVITVSVNNGWTQEQEDIALSDIQEAYNNTYSDPDFSGFEIGVSWLLPWAYDPEEGNIETVKAFYAYLASIAVERWKGFPKYDGLMTILGLSEIVSDDALAEKDSQSLATQISGAAEMTAVDIAEGAENIIEAVSDNKFWYVLGGIAAILIAAPLLRR